MYVACIAPSCDGAVCIKINCQPRTKRELARQDYNWIRAHKLLSRAASLYIDGDAARLVEEAAYVVLCTN